MILAAVILWTLVALMVSVGIWGVFIEPNRLEVAELRVPIPRLPQSLAGLKVAHLSDWHLSGRGSTRAVAERACQQIMSRAPDLSCLTGDLVTQVVQMPEAIPLLNSLQAPLGVYLVLGNHDCNATMEDMLYGHEPQDCAEDTWRTELSSGPVALLDNEARRAECGDARIVVAGVGDVTAGRDDLPRTMSVAPAGDLHILLSHSPDILDEPEVEWADLVLCGHTHGGQLVLPGYGSVWAPVWRLRHRASGLWRMNGTLAFITRGVGSGFRMRINCQPEVAMLELHPGTAEDVPETPQVSRGEVGA
ncbi:MAG: hypothetical protein GX100_02205 [candidate division WS1 bacterium]|nr:hypothetical protein [candidate division WS1 bacterium]